MKSLLQKVTIDEQFTTKTTDLLPVFKAILHCKVQPTFLYNQPTGPWSKTHKASEDLPY